MNRKKGRATLVQSLAVNAALRTLRGGGLSYGGGGGRSFGGGCVSAGPPLAPRDGLGMGGEAFPGQGESLAPLGTSDAGSGHTEEHPPWCLVWWGPGGNW